jgi:hypothetical protein
VNAAIGRQDCHRCQSHGNPLELWAAATKLPLHQAAIDPSGNRADQTNPSVFCPDFINSAD